MEAAEFVLTNVALFIGKVIPRIQFVVGVGFMDLNR